MIKNLNDGSDRPPALKIYLNLGTLRDLPDWSIWPRDEGEKALHHLKSLGFSGVQDGIPELCRKASMGATATGRVIDPTQAKTHAESIKSLGHAAATLHVGTGCEDDSEMDALVYSVLKASEELDFPLYIETHRATITQDVWRTLQLIRRIPEIRLNVDFSHYYTGQEMAYGDIENKWERMAPIFERTGFMHGRIGNTACMQVDIGDGENCIPQVFAGSVDFVAHFREMWIRAMCGFLRNAAPGDYLIFAPEILPPSIYYGRQFQLPGGVLREESDRFAQALVYKKIAEACFAEAQKRTLK